MSPPIASAFDRAKLSLEGLALGDAFGDRFFAHEAIVANMVAARAMPMAPWCWTDDTEMALSIVSVLRRYGEIDRNALASSFAERYDRSRKYGASMHGLLASIQAGKSWREEAGTLFSGQGSFGNGAAMRVAPVGAYFADDLDMVVPQARRAAEVTHAHPEAIAGAIAIAVAAALAWRERGRDTPRFLDLVLPYIPDSEVRDGIRRARDLAPGASVRLAVAALGNGTRISA
ncbi:MAG TPA: ADP-ribosylglycohydrolase family protein, partial [Chloroflexota bacterium]|nr:ADP-ribosylglycohydrolase family protein [Chloroflexota bacterium]